MLRATPRVMEQAAYEDALTLYRRLRDDSDAYISAKVGSALDVLEQAIRLYGPAGVFGSYNGGKDAVVVMHLMRAALANHASQDPQWAGGCPRPRLIYFAQPNEFPEVASLVEETSMDYDLDLITYRNVSFVNGLRACIESEGGRPLAFLLGTRKGDPNCKEQETYAPSSSWMPAFMRVNPILDWQYGHVWHFLRRYDLPYCSLYDEGYTSLGSVDDTIPNPSLAKPDGSGHLPAYLLADWSLERAGRIDKKAQKLECELKDLDCVARRVQNAQTAGLIIIGDEILKGKTADTNSIYATKRLRENGIQVKRIVVLSDEEDEILAEVRDHVQRYDVVITSGGVGPTHDDVTIRAVAGALGQSVRVHPEMLSKLQEAYGLQRPEDLTEGQKKMALLPELAQLRIAPGNELWPILQCENVFILPGVPAFFEAKVDTIATHFLGRRPLFTRKVVLGVDEIRIVDALNEAVARFGKDGVLFGSYPFVGKSGDEFKCIVTLEGETEEAVNGACTFLMEKVPPKSVLAVEEDDSLR